MIDSIAFDPFSTRNGVMPESKETIAPKADLLGNMCAERYNEFQSAIEKREWTDSGYPSKLDCYRFYKSDLEELVLSPFEIIVASKQLLAQGSTRYLGQFLTYLIQISYNNGYNNFQLENMCIPKQSGFHYIGAYLIGKEDAPLRLSVSEDVTNGFGYGAKNCEFTLAGDANDMLGEDAEGCRFIVVGRCRDFAGFAAKGSIFRLEGGFKDELGYESKGCIFETHNPLLYEGMCREFSEHNLVTDARARLLGANDEILEASER
jgi:hypothetical protein